MLTPPQAIEAILFTAGEPLEKKRLASLLGIRSGDLEVALAALTEQLKGRGLSIIEAGDAVELRTNAQASDILKKLRESELARDLGRASLETLAVIAYQNGATRSEVDWVRGVNSSASMRTLLLRGLIEGGEDPTDKRRIRYRLTTEALAHMGLRNTTELPRYDELARGAAVALEASQTAFDDGVIAE